MASATELALLGTAAAWARWHPATTKVNGTDANKASESRLALYDTAKAIAMFSLIVAHWTLGDLLGNDTDYKTWLQGGEVGVKAIFNFAASFRMSLICIISGVCSQGPPTVKRVRNYFQYLVVPSVLWIGIFHTVVCNLLVNTSVPESHITALVRGEWYLSSLVIWRGAGFICFHKLHPVVLLLLAQIVSFVGGYFRFGGNFGAETWYWQFLAVDCSIGFLPYYVLGYILPLPAILRAVPEPSRLMRLGFLLCVIFWAELVGPALDFGGDPHFSFRDQDSFPAASQVDFWLYWTRRLVRWGRDVVPALAVLILVLPRAETCWTWMGPHTLSPYLFHYVFLEWRVKLQRHFPPPVVTSAAGHALVLMFNVFLCYLATVVFCSSGWRKAFGWLLKPDWLDPVMDGLTLQGTAAK